MTNLGLLVGAILIKVFCTDSVSKCKLRPKILIQPPRFAIDTRDNSLSSYFETKRHNITIDTKQNLIYQLGYESLVGSLENQHTRVFCA